ncbi:hypothetical protein Tco_0414449 [Tanacetum coccineum]
MSNSNINLQTQSSNALHNAIMEAGSKDRPPMLAPGNYVQWKSRIKRYIDTKPNSELIHYCLQNPPYTYQWAEKTVPVAEGSSETTTERYMENYKNVSQDIRDQLNAEAEAVQIILTGIDNDIYSTVDACPNACEMWKAIERLKQGESINVQDLETNLYWEFGKFTSRDGESLESYYSRFYKMMNELVACRNQCHVTNHQVNVPVLYFTTTRHGQSKERKGDCTYANPLAPGAQQQPKTTTYKQQLRTSSTPVELFSNSPDSIEELGMIIRGIMVARVGKITSCWKDDTDDKLKEQEIGANYMYMDTLQEGLRSSCNSGPIFDDEPCIRWDTNITIDSSDTVMIEPLKNQFDVKDLKKFQAELAKYIDVIMRQDGN